MIYQGLKQYPVTEAILHCAAVPTGWADGKRAFQVFAEINRWHVERGWKGFGYHGLFMPDGTYLSGRPFHQIGAHCIEANRGTLGFLLIESRKVTGIGAFSDWFTEAQARSLREVLARIDGLTSVVGHNHYSRKLCPGFKVETGDWL